MTIGFSREDVAAELAVHLDANLTISTTISYMGEEIDTESVNDWMEVWLPELRRIPQRRSALDQRRGTILIRCYAKKTTSQYRIYDMVDDVIARLRHTDITVRDLDAVGTPTVGLLRVFEPSVDDDSRDFNSPMRSDVRVASIEFDCYVQA